MNFLFALLPLGVIQSITVQHGQRIPSQIRKISHIGYIFYPFSYLCRPSLLTSLNLTHVPLHTFTILILF